MKEGTRGVRPRDYTLDKGAVARQPKWARESALEAHDRKSASPTGINWWGPDRWPKG